MMRQKQHVNVFEAVGITLDKEVDSRIYVRKATQVTARVNIVPAGRLQ